MPIPNISNLEQFLDDVRLAVRKDDDFESNGGFYSEESVKESLSRLQSEGLIPYEKKELDLAIKLLRTCVDLIGNDCLDINWGLDVLLTTVKNAQEKGWGSLYQSHIDSLPKKDGEVKVWDVQARDIKDALVDNMKSLFCPRFFRAVRELGVEHPLHQSCMQGPINDPFFGDRNLWFTRRSPLFKQISILCKGKNIIELAAFSAHWHAPLQQTAFHKFKTVNDGQWPSLFHTKVLEIPEDITGKKGYKFIARTSPAELTAEGEMMNHCVGGYASKCQRESTHIISCVNELDKSISTIELEIQKEADTGQYRIYSIQHRAANNNDPSIEAQKAHDWLLKSLNNGTIPVDFDYLETDRSTRLRIEGDTMLRFERSVHSFIEFNPFGEQGLKAMSSVKKLYLKHTPPDFIANLKELIQLQTMEVSLADNDQPAIIEVDLLRKEERAKVNNKKDRASKWTPKQWKDPKPAETSLTDEAESKNELK